MKTINVDDFIKWLKNDTKRDLTYTQKAVIKNVVNDYADKYGLEVVQKQLKNEAYEEWLDKGLEWAGQGVVDATKGLRTRTYNMIMRCGEYDHEKGKWEYPIRTNRDLLNVSNTYLLQNTRIGKNGLAEIKEYLECHKKMFLGMRNERM